ncbi:hypothetical protein CAP40_01495 [Sphingomonas sp. IBVSS2]|uniref:hypothetical protein n=1 Tax=Sphingomonas sp. IBVSS2 TaxID=1985172 RepID=UPI000A2D31E1|nr:hypothetical protein [Sphingomonas sp. IBVSS2]OSZ69558.1 hypothetical protein CAP40_01495 [Sphingomonas sp. IBVSS2]
MTASSSKQPSHRLFTVKGEGDNTSWLPIGAAWPNRDGQGFTLILDALPIDGRVVMREIAERDGGSQ